MASNVDICNLALTELGAARITSLSDDTKQARALNAVFDMKRDDLLTAHPWSFAIKRSQIPASATAPDFGWSYAYPVPSDYMKLVQIGDEWTFYDAGDSGALFDVEGRAILTNEVSPLKIRYVYRVTNAGLFSPSFVVALAALLRVTICDELSASGTKYQAAVDAYRDAIQKAKRANDIERPPQRVQDTSWVRAMTGMWNP